MEFEPVGPAVAARLLTRPVTRLKLGERGLIDVNQCTSNGPILNLALFITQRAWSRLNSNHGSGQQLRYAMNSHSQCHCANGWALLHKNVPGYCTGPLCNADMVVNVHPGRG